MDRIITLRECLSLDVFADAEMISCRESWNNPVACISVLDAHFDMDLFRKAKTDPYLLYMVSDDILLQPDNVVRESIDLIVEKKGAGLIIFSKNALVESMPKTLRDYALYKNLPLIGLKRGRDISFGAIIQNVMHLILTGDETDDTVRGFFDLLLYRPDNYTNRQRWIGYAEKNRVGLVICVPCETEPSYPLTECIKTHFAQYSIPASMAVFQNIVALSITSAFSTSAARVLPELIKLLADNKLANSLFYTDIKYLIKADRHTISSIAGYFPYMRVIFPHKALVTYSDLVFTAQCRMIVEKELSVPTSQEALLFPLYEESAGKLDLVNTLFVWMLEAGRNTQSASEILNIHPNTMQYRLKKVKELLSLDIEDTPSLAILSVALGVMRIKNNPDL